MNYNEYDRLQIELGGVADSFKNDVKHIINLSAADPETKELISAVCDKFAASLSELSILVSTLAKLSIE